MPLTDRHDSTDTRLAAERMLAALANDATDPREAADPIDPIDSTDPTDPIDSTDPMESIDRTDPFERMDKTELLNSSTFPGDTPRAPGLSAGHARASYGGAEAPGWELV